jgi:nicotinamide-nucleotide amidase
VDVLGVSHSLIDTHSVVSEPVAASMAEQVRKKFNATMGVATTGNAGPTKGDSDAEIGTVYIAISAENEIVTEKFIFGIHRERVVEKAVNKALEMIYKQLR